MKLSVRAFALARPAQETSPRDVVGPEADAGSPADADIVPAPTTENLDGDPLASEGPTPTATRAEEMMPECKICLSPMRMADHRLAMPCGHAFHADCINKHLEMSGQDWESGCPFKCGQAVESLSSGSRLSDEQAARVERNRLEALERRAARRAARSAPQDVDSGDEVIVQEGTDAPSSVDVESLLAANDQEVAQRSSQI